MDTFHEFCEALMDLHRQLDEGSIGAPVVHESLIALLNRQEGDAQRRLGRYGLETFHGAKYAMAALADEILLRRDCGGHAKEWMDLLLETRLFRSQRAGEKVFDNIDELQSLGVAASELAPVYLAVLGFGFQGVFRDRPNAAKEMAVYRQKLFAVAYGEPIGSSLRQQIARAAYVPTLTDGEGGELPHLKPWVYMLLLLVVAYITGAAAIWHDASYDLVSIIHTINSPAAAKKGARQ